ncbi:hybrid sensor histidine kinase/response regulator transcription factor [Ekhidna sp. To15]|uniref:hybrid sensor histidine kinase/response regulator transcription factor n=1 Tax=Ekhidna sp. To15 TaxID=3395267 RepID=UPI003F51CD6D
MLSRLFPPILLLLIPLITICQSEIDSLNTLLDKRDLPDSSRVNILLAYYFTDLYYTDQEKVLQQTYDALFISESINYQEGISQSLITLGGIYRLRSENDSAFKYYKSAIEHSKSIKNKSSLMDAYMGLGNTFNQVSDWQQAIEQFQKVEELAIEARDSVTIGSVNNNIGNTYLNQAMLQKALEHYQISLRMGDDGIQKVSLINIAITYASLDQLEKAREYYQQAIEKQGDNSNPNHLAFIYKNLGIVEKKSGNFDEALAMFNKALAINQNLSNDYQISDLFYSIGNLYFDQKKYNDALIEYQKSLEIREQIQHQVGRCFSLIAMGMTYQELNQHDKAISLLLEADMLAGEINMVTAKNDISQILSNIYASVEDYKKAYEYQVAFKQFSDSLKTIRNEEKIAELEEKYQNEQKQQEIDLLSAENEISSLQIQRQESLRNYLLLGAVLLITLLGVIYNQYKIKARANNRLKDLDHLKTSFFTNISHEFRTPLSLILSPVQKLLSENPPTGTRKDLGLIQKNATRLLELTNQIMDLSKLEAGKLTLDVRHGNLKEFLEILTASFESLALAKKIDFTISLDNLPEQAYFDEDKLQKILTNLLSNAFKFTPANGSVELIVYSKKEDEVSISIKDSGPGIAPAELKEIFERFHQSKSIDSNTTGTGIGLALTKELSTLHHGKIDVQSKTSEGSTFTFSFPISRAAYATFEIVTDQESEFSLPDNAKANWVDNQPANGSEDEGKPIALIVEDNPDLRTHIRHLLESTYQIEESINGKEGIASAIKHVPDIIISDLMMPEADGLELCKTVKLSEKTSHIPVILLTAKADRDTKIHGLTTGADEYLTKPFDNDELLVRVKNLIESRTKLKQKFSQTLKLEPSQIEVTSPDEAFIRKAMETVNKYLADEAFNVESFQKEMAMSRMQLHRKLKALTNFSASEFIRDLRLQRASTLLSNGHMNVAETAYSCGFNSLSYFTECFKEKYGATPSKFTKKGS